MTFGIEDFFIKKAVEIDVMSAAFFISVTVIRTAGSSAHPTGRADCSAGTPPSSPSTPRRSRTTAATRWPQPRRTRLNTALNTGRRTCRARSMQAGGWHCIHQVYLLNDTDGAGPRSMVRQIMEYLEKKIKNRFVKM